MRVDLSSLRAAGAHNVDPELVTTDDGWIAGRGLNVPSPVSGAPARFVTPPGMYLDRASSNVLVAIGEELLADEFRDLRLALPVDQGDAWGS